MFENYYTFFHYCRLSCRYSMLQKSILNEPKWGAQAVVRGGRRPWPHCSDGTGYQYKKWYLSGNFCELTVKNNKAILWTRAANSNLNPKKVGCFAELEKAVLTPIWIRLDPLVIACLAARRILHISAVIPHFGYKYNNVIPHKTPKI